MSSSAGGAQLRDEELATLRSWTRSPSPSVSAGEVLRARIVLAAGGGRGPAGDARRAERRMAHARAARRGPRFGLQPWRRETFKFSTDPELEAKVRDVIGLYLNPPEKAIVLCVDEKSQIQALDRP